MNNNLVFIGPLWGTPNQKAHAGDNIERVELPDEWSTSSDHMRIRLTRDTSLRIIRRPTWTWRENPTDEMARKRPRCEVKLYGFSCNHLGRLVHVSKYTLPFTADVDNHGMQTITYCRVRLDANGEVLVDWEGEE